MGNNELYDWLYLADADIDSALFLKSGRPQHKEIICFHCQQSAEKYLKAFLVSCQTEPSKTHDLRVLCELCQVQDNSFAELNLMCSYLNPFGVQPRYPHEFGHYRTDNRKSYTLRANNSRISGNKIVAGQI